MVLVRCASDATKQIPKRSFREEVRMRHSIVSGSRCVHRGGCWISFARYVLAADYIGDRPRISDYRLGVRLMRRCI